MFKRAILVQLIFITILIFKAQAQKDHAFSYKDFENEVLKYKPEKSDQVTQQKFDYGVMILNETAKSVKNNPINFNLADYFNILTAFATLKESDANIKLAFEKFKNAPGSCEYFIMFEKNINESPIYEPIKNLFNTHLALCKSGTMTILFDIEDYARKNKLNLNLVKLIHAIELADQKFRTSKDLNKQKTLDLKNQKQIDSLYQNYHTYIGKSLVGEKLAGTMFLVIQHSNLEMMEKYLPVIQKAVQEKEIPLAALKMLIDRVYGLKYGYQIFGSQTGFGFANADEKTRLAIKKKYGID
ncbi:hypothetical protein [Pedobacter sp. UC225_65]|uniref:hypothetical protein n=1 Tax=Pedobacter sp. UC225_65 TaxID=3350173 RepID=UPI00367079C4